MNTYRISTISLLLSSACVAVVVEANEDSDGEMGSGETGDGDGDGDGDPGDGDGAPGDGDGDAQPESFRVVVLADCHVPGSTAADDDASIMLARDRLKATRDQIAAIDPPPAFVVVIGDMVHNAYVSNEELWFQTNPNAFADVVDIFNSLPMPVYPVFGDSDYAVPDAPQSFSHLLFADFFATDPHSSLDYLGWRFVFANSQEGQTFVPNTLQYNTSIGSFGTEQLGWLGEQLSAGMPTVLFSHFPMFAVQAAETNDGPYPDLESVLTQTGDSVALVLSGHTSKWTDLPASYAAPHFVVGATRYDSDNFLLIEFTTDALQYQILDLGKAHWDAMEADTWIYDGYPMPGP